MWPLCCSQVPLRVQKHTIAGWLCCGILHTVRFGAGNPALHDGAVYDNVDDYRNIHCNWRFRKCEGWVLERKGNL